MLLLSHLLARAQKCDAWVAGAACLQPNCERCHSEVQLRQREATWLAAQRQAASTARQAAAALLHDDRDEEAEAAAEGSEAAAAAEAAVEAAVPAPEPKPDSLGVLPGASKKNAKQRGATQNLPPGWWEGPAAAPGHPAGGQAASKSAPAAQHSPPAASHEPSWLTHLAAPALTNYHMNQAHLLAPYMPGQATDLGCVRACVRACVGGGRRAGGRGVLGWCGAPFSTSP